MFNAWKYWLAAIVVVGGAVWGVAHFVERPIREPHGMKQIVQWVREQELDNGIHKLELPDELREYSADKTIVVVQRTKTSFVVLVKTLLLPQWNYHGFVFSTEPLGEQDFGVEPYNDAKTIRFDVPGMVDPMINRQIDPNTFEVYYNLG